MNPVQAIEKIRESREVAWPNPEFQKQLSLWYEYDCRTETAGGNVIPEWFEYTYERPEPMLPAVIYNPEFG